MTRKTDIIICFLSSINEPVTSNWVHTQLIADLQNEYNIYTIKLNKYTTDELQKNSHDISSEIIHSIKKFKFVNRNILFFTMLFDKYLNDDLFQFLDSRSIISVNYLVDSITIPYKYYVYARKFTFIAVPFYQSLDFFKKKGINNVVYFPYGTSILLNNYYKISKQNSISFVGSNYGARPYYINFLIKNNLQIDVKGNNWKYKLSLDLTNSKTYANNVDLIKNLIQFKDGRKILLSKFLKYFKSPDLFNFNYEKILNDQDVFKFISEHNLSLGISEYGSTYLLKNPILHYRMRDLECPMLGSCHITHSSVDLFNLYEEDKEILYYTNHDELKNKLTFYLKNPSLSSKIGFNANIRSQLSNRWLNRFDDFINKFIV
jgi:hypothetical protein